MSEYQYYEFQAVDRPLGEREQAELRALSTRAQITATSFVNSYEWGSFRGDPARLMERYFDLFLYLANWGSREFSMRLPKRMVDPAELERFVIGGDAATIRETADWVIVDVSRDEVDAADWDDGRGWLAALASLRADVLSGDLRAFYLIWLMSVAAGDTPDDALEPLPGIAPLTASLEAFAGFFDIDEDLVAAAASGGPANPLSEPAPAAVADCIRALSEDEKVALLVRLYEGGDPHLASAFRRRVRRTIGAPSEAPEKRRTVAELREIADRLAAERERAEAERAETERRRKEEAQAAARRSRMDALAARGEAAWREVESLIGLRNASGYEQAVVLLTDLRDLARESGRSDDFGRRLVETRRRHEKKRGFLDRLRAAGLN